MVRGTGKEIDTGVVIQNLIVISTTGRTGAKMNTSS